MFVITEVTIAARTTWLTFGKPKDQQQQQQQQQVESPTSENVRSYYRRGKQQK
jgi:hypothetical protein